MKCVIALAILAVALPAVFGAPRPGYLAGPTFLRSADLLDGTVISAPATLAFGPSAISSQSTVIAHSAPIAVAHSGLVAAAPALLPAGRTTVVAGPSGTITETQGLGLGGLAVSAW